MGDPVLYYQAPPLPFGAIDWPTPLAFVAYTGVDPLNLGSHEGLDYLLSCAPLDASQRTTSPAPPLPFGEIDYPLPLNFGWQGASPTIYPAATLGRSSKPADLPANTYVPAKLNPSFPYRTELFTGAEPLSSGTNTVGVIHLDDPDGELDNLLGVGWDGAPLQISRGSRDALFSTWSVVGNVTAAGMLYDRHVKEIQLRDLSWLLRAAPLHDQRYTGAGGMNGDSALRGLIKPYAVGAFVGASPVLFVGALLCYQVSCSSVRAFTAVYDGGLALINDGDDPDYASLSVATIAAGHYRTCLAQGIFRLGGKPALIVTVDGQGDNDTLFGHTYPSSRGQIARRIATGRGAVTLDDVTGLDNPSFTELDNKQGAAVGYYWSAEMSKAAALDECLRGCLGWWFMRLNGTLAVGVCEDPANLPPYLSLSFPAAGAGEIRVSDLTMTDYKVPRRQTFIGWAKNYTPLQINQIAGAVDIATNVILQAPTRYAGSADAWATNSFPTGAVVQIDGGFAVSADAQAEADRQQGLMRSRRERYSLRAALDPFGDFIGRVIAVANFNRLGFGASKNFLCVGMAYSGGTTTLELWG